MYRIVGVGVRCRLRCFFVATCHDAYYQASRHKADHFLGFAVWHEVIPLLDNQWLVWLIMSGFMRGSNPVGLPFTPNLFYTKLHRHLVSFAK